jgi:hypothetical protein
MKPLTLRLLAYGLLWAAAFETHGQDRSNPYLKSISIPNAPPETNPPLVSVEYPTNGQQVGQSVIQTLITATDDTRVEAFRFSVNGMQGDWDWAPGMQWPWGAPVQLNPGINTFEVECADYWGNLASTSVTFDYVPGSAVTSQNVGVSGPTPQSVPATSESMPASGLVLDIGNGGQVSPDYRGKTLQPGQTYSMTAHPAKGFRFNGWSGSLSNSRPKLRFVMQTYLSLSARFKDISRPINITTFPRANRTVTSPVIATGKAADNSGVTNVYYQLNDSGWATALTTNGWMNWETAALSPVPGRNVLESYAMDDSGLSSRTNRLRFHY